MKTWPQSVLIGAVRAYRFFLSPWLGSACRFEPTCSAYALDALGSDAERDRFARHLRRCPSCAAEVRGFRTVATAMAFAVTAEPPPELRGRVLAAAERTPPRSRIAATRSS